MEVIKIPRLQKKHTEYVILKDLELFIQLSYLIIKKGPIFVLQKIRKHVQLPVPEIRQLFSTLQEAAFCYHERDDANIQHTDETNKSVDVIDPSSPEGTQICTAELSERWSGKKACLIAALKEHTDILQSLERLQKRCWYSRAKVTKYVSLTDAARCSLQFQSDTLCGTRKRKKALADLQTDLARRRAQHAQRVGEYQDVLESENTLRGKIKQMSCRLSDEVQERLTARMNEALRNLLTITDPARFILDIVPNLLSQGLYDAISRSYLFRVIPEDVNCPAFNMPIEPPRMTNSLFCESGVTDIETYEKRQKSTVYGSKYTVREGKFDLVIEEGDIIKQKLLSRDETKAFGSVKRSLWSRKLWGIFSTAVTDSDSD